MSGRTLALTVDPVARASARSAPDIETAGVAHLACVARPRLRQPGLASLIVAALAAVVGVGGAADAATQTINGSVIQVSVTDDMAPTVAVRPSTDLSGPYVGQYFGGDAWGTVVWLNGGAIKYSSPYHSESAFTPVSNTLVVVPGGSQIVTVVTLGDTGLRLTQIFRYIEGDRFLTKEFLLENTGSQTYTDVRFFHGGDSYFGGDDSSYGFYDPAKGMVYVRNNDTTSWGLMGYSAHPDTPVTHYFEGRYDVVYDYLTVGGTLPDSVESNYVDAGYALQWNRASLAPGQSWTLRSTEIWTAAGSVQVLAPASRNVLAPSNVSLPFTVQNLGTSQATFSLTVTSSVPAWVPTIVGGSSVIIPGNSSTTVDVQVAVPSGATGSSGITLSASGDGTSQGTTTLTVATVPTIAGVAPASGPLAGGTLVTITGANLGPAGATVLIGGQTAPFAPGFPADPSTLVVTSPAATTSGPRDVVVTTGGGSATLAGGFTYDAAQNLDDISAANAATIQPSLNGDGRYLAFASSASNLVAGDLNGLDDVFVLDRTTRSISLISAGADGSGANGDSARPRISADGRYVAFASAASNLVAGDTNGVSDVFVHDRDTDADGVFDEAGATATIRVSVSSVGSEANAASGQHDLSPDGFWVALVSAASNLVPDDTNGVDDVFLHHWPSGQTRRVSVATGGGQANGPSRAPAVSANAARAVFASDATNLVAGDGNGTRDVFLHERGDASTVRVSTAEGTNGLGDANGDSDRPSIDDAGTTIAFETTATNIVPGTSAPISQVVLFRLGEATSEVAVDGRVGDAVVSIADALRNLLSSAAAGQSGNAASTSPEVSGSGNAVAFESSASDLTSSDTNGVKDVFVSQVPQSGAPTSPHRVSVDSSGDQANGPSQAAALSGDGRFTSFESSAGLTPGTQGSTDTNVFVRGELLLVSAVTPDFATAGTQPEVKLTGSGFVNGTRVRIGGGDLIRARFQDATTIFADVPVSAAGVADVTVENPDGSSVTLQKAFTFTAAPGATTDTDNDGMADDWERSFGLDPSSAAGHDGADGDPDGDGVTNLQEFQQSTNPNGLFTRYFAEGATSDFFTTRFGLANPSDQAVTALLRFQRSDGVQITHQVTIPARQSRKVTANDVAGMATAEFSTVVEADAPLALHRLVSWDRSREYGSHAEAAVTAPATVWYLAEGSTNAGFQLFYLVQNPGTVAANIEVTFLLPSGAPVLKPYTVPASSRFNIWVNTIDELASTDLSAVVRSTNGQPVIVERAMYLNSQGLTFGAGHESAGVTEPATSWFLAEGATGSYFDMFVLLANPGSTAANVDATYLRPDGQTVTKTYVVEPQSRYTVWVDFEDPLLADTAVSVTLVSRHGVPILVERAMWWPGSLPTWHEAHNSFGTVVTGTAWGLGEGAVGGPPANASTYVLIANTSATQARVAVTVLFSDDTPAVTREFLVEPTSRFNVDVSAEFSSLGVAGKGFGVYVESLANGGQPPAQIVVEQALYRDDNAGVHWAAGSNSLATRFR